MKKKYWLIIVIIFLGVGFFAWNNPYKNKLSDPSIPGVLTPIPTPTSTPTPTPTPLIVDKTTDLKMELSKLTPSDFTGDFQNLKDHTVKF